MSQQNVETARGAYDGFNRGDIPSVLESYDAEIEWVEPGGGNARRARSEAATAFNRTCSAGCRSTSTNSPRRPTSSTTKATGWSSRGRFRGKAKSGAELDAPFEHVLEMRDGKVVRFENNVDQTAWAQGWS